MSLTAGTRDQSAFEQAAGRLLDQVVDATASEYRDVPVERVLVGGSPTDALLGVARDADARGGLARRRRLPRLLLGSVSQQLAHHAPCPVVVVPGATRSRPPVRTFAPGGTPVPRPTIGRWKWTATAWRCSAATPAFACWPAPLGRVGVSGGALPSVLPVNFRFDGRQILIRTGVGTKLDAAVANAVVAFEVDEIDPVAHTAGA